MDLGNIEPQAAALTIQVLTGVSPSLASDGKTLQFQGDSAEQARVALNQWLFAARSNSAVEGHPTVYQMRSVIWPVLFRQMWWVLLLAAVLGYYVGSEHGDDIKKTVKGAFR